MPDKKTAKETKKVKKATSSKVSPPRSDSRGKLQDTAESTEETKAEVEEKELLHEAEEREKERKEAEEAEKEEAKVAAKEAKKEERIEKVQAKASVRHKPRHGKKLRKAAELIEAGKLYPKEEAVKLSKETSITKFDGTLEIHIKISKKLENVRGTMTLPSGAVKQKKVLEVTDKNIDETIAKVKSGKIDFEIIVAHPSVMPKLAGLAKILGPKGLMPNPKAGTVSEDVAAAAEEFRGGRIEYRADKSNIVHIAIAKVSTPDEKILENIEVILSQFPSNRIDSIYLTTSMGPSVRVETK